VAAPAATSRFGPEPRVVLAPVEAAAIEVARERLGRPRLSGALVLAARELARRAAAGAANPLDRASLRDALSRGSSYDPAPAAFLVQHRGDRPEDALARVLRRGSATHVGAGAFEADGSVVLVVLASTRRARLDPLPREVPARGGAVLSGKLASGLLHPRVFVTLPGGTVREEEVSGGAAFKAELGFPEVGRYLVEVVAHGPGGPEVVALLAITAGGAPPPEPVAIARPSAEPEDRAAAEAGVVEALNALRARRGLAPVAVSPELSGVARRHSEAMLAAARIAHVLPRSGPVDERLARAGIAYRRVYENVARGASALTAHEFAEESPAHLGNMLRPAATRVGVGVALGRNAAGDATTYLTEILIEPLEDGAASRLTPDARVREALWRERARMALPPLTADAALDALARDAAETLRASDAAERGDLERRALALPRRLAAVDVFVASAPGDAVRSANLRDPRFRRVGVGLVEGTSRRFGSRRLFITVAYTD
jgi:uncharacterized protein YkwD